MIFKKRAKTDTVPLRRLFSFSSTKDYILTTVSLTSALINGVCLPILVIIFGDLANVIVYEVTSSNPNSTTSQCQNISQESFVKK